MTAVSEIDRAGVYDIPEAEYFAATHALSCSGAKLLLPPSCPAKFFWRQDHQEYKAVWDLGSGAHNLVLGTGPEIIEVHADSWRTKAAQQEQEQARAAGKIPLLSKDVATVHAMAGALKAHPVAYALFDPYYGRAEQSLFWQDERTGIWRRARLDWLPDAAPGQRVIIADYKTCDCADPAAISKAVANYGYHMQHAWYADGAAAVLGADIAFVFCFQEKTPPYLVNVVELESDAVRIGRNLNNRAIDIYQACVKTGEWPGYGDDIDQIDLPAWASREDYEL